MTVESLSHDGRVLITCSLKALVVIITSAAQEAMYSYHIHFMFPVITRRKSVTWSITIILALPNG